VIVLIIPSIGMAVAVKLVLFELLRNSGFTTMLKFAGAEKFCSVIKVK
jgi:hypothetical protein